MVAKARTDTLQRFIPIPESGCWLWDGPWFDTGYGKAPSGRRNYGAIAHRVFYRALVGEIPAGMVICHKCDTPPCVNPDHLVAASRLANNDDMWAKGRARPRGKSAVLRERPRRQRKGAGLRLTNLDGADA